MHVFIRRYPPALCVSVRMYASGQDRGFAPSQDLCYSLDLPFRLKHFRIF